MTCKCTLNSIIHSCPQAGTYAHTSMHACTHNICVCIPGSHIHLHMHSFPGPGYKANTLMDTCIYMIVLNQILTLIFPFSCIPCDVPLSASFHVFFNPPPRFVVTPLSLSTFLPSFYPLIPHLLVTHHLSEATMNNPKQWRL